MAGATDFWWSSDATEKYWVEIRWIGGIGTELRCPTEDASGRSNPWYDLTAEVRPQHVVYHWNAREHRFVGRSLVAAPPQIVSGERVVPLVGFTPIRSEVALETLRDSEPLLRSVRDDLRVQHPGKSLYLPFQYRSDGIRMMSNYFAKCPAEVVGSLFGASGLADGDASLEPTTDEDVEPLPRFRGGFLKPFKPKADTDYVSRVGYGHERRSRKHETVVNEFSLWLEVRGLDPGVNAAIDLGTENPPSVIECKIIGSRPASKIRAGVGQLYEYRYFEVVEPDSALILLVNRKLHTTWVEYLERDRGIGVVWPEAPDWYLSPMATAGLGLV
jgi:hypothetical protein